MNPVFLNGQYGTTDDMKVSVLDRGFLFGDGVYEVYRVYNRAAFTRPLHLARLRRSLAGIEIVMPYSDAEFEAILDRMEQLSPADCYIYIHVTRGVAPRRHAFPDHAHPSVMVMAVPLGVIPAGLFTAGVGLLSMPDERWLRCGVKSLNLLANCQAMTAAGRAGCFEALLVGGDGLVNESAASSFFAVVDGQLRTAPLERNILPGVTRHVLIDLAEAAGLAVEQRAMDLDEVRRASEALVSNSVYEVLPVTSIDGRMVGDGRPGPTTRRLAELFAAKVAAETGAVAVCAAAVG